MQELLLRFIFTIVYLVVDIIYVISSKPVYEIVATKIQGSGFPAFTASRAIGAAVAYTSMALAWYFLVVPVALSWVRERGWHPVLAGAAAGAIYGLVVYGVFNGSLHAMFDKYDLSIVARDMAWGLSWSVVITALYIFVATK